MGLQMVFIVRPAIVFHGITCCVTHLYGTTFGNIEAIKQVA